MSELAEVETLQCVVLKSNTTMQSNIGRVSDNHFE